IAGIGDSFKLVPPGSLFLTPEVGRQVLTFAAQIFTMAIRIAAPVVAAIFMVDLALGLISKVSPQIHVLMLGFPIKITVGLFFLGLVFILVAEYVGDFVAGMDPLLRNLLKALGGGRPEPL
ncbi:MAG: flagellar biosynthetic protein FliR, partial [Desulfovibrionaceae bacterium]